MTENLLLALWITVIGMGLVFTAIVLLWGVMALLVKYTSNNAKHGQPQHEISSEVNEERSLATAAAIAVAIAFQEDTTHPHEFPLPPTANVSPWQSVMRSKMLNKRGQAR
jgi:Na+-transporting methylmalonyl-CoA/oxaloacetate decarboxylase gamma subunit